MNGIFFFLFTLSLIVLCFKSPDNILTIVSNAGEKAVALTLKLLVIYSFWLGIVNIMEDSKINNKISRNLSPVIKILFGNVSPIAERYISLNLSANLLGMGGIATPMGISAISELEKTKNTYAQFMLMVITSTSIQIIPMSVLSLRAVMGSTNVNNVILPSLLSTIVSTTCGILLTKIFLGKYKK